MGKDVGGGKGKDAKCFLDIVLISLTYIYFQLRKIIRMSMLLHNKETGSLVEINDFLELINPSKNEVVAHDRSEITNVVVAGPGCCWL